MAAYYLLTNYVSDYCRIKTPGYKLKLAIQLSQRTDQW